MLELILFIWAMMATCLLLRWWLLDRKKILEAQIQKVLSIQAQLVEVRKIEISPSNKTEKWRMDAVSRCEEVEKTVVMQYNDMLKVPKNYVIARFFGFPTRYTCNQKNKGWEAP